MSLGVSDVETKRGIVRVSLFFVTDYFWIPSDEHDSRFQESRLQQHHISDAAHKRKVNWN
ncbi:hypothetical protein J6590_038282 [Homalodisca vitripennis]|nr:hypothetical protein J6590_038282 [Homalodisca vitripennis]